MPLIVAQQPATFGTFVHPALPHCQQLAISLERQRRGVVRERVQPAIGGQAICVVDEGPSRTTSFGRRNTEQFFEIITTAPIGPSPIGTHDPELSGEGPCERNAAEQRREVSLPGGAPEPGVALEPFYDVRAGNAVKSGLPEAQSTTGSRAERSV